MTYLFLFLFFLVNIYYFLKIPKWGPHFRTKNTLCWNAIRFSRDYYYGHFTFTQSHACGDQHVTLTKNNVLPPHSVILRHVLLYPMCDACALPPTKSSLPHLFPFSLSAFPIWRMVYLNYKLHMAILKMPLFFHEGTAFFI